MPLTGKRRKISPCKDREAIYEMMAGWSFDEVNKVNFDVLDWLEKTVLIFRSRLSQEQKTTRLVNPEQFLGHLADGKLLARLVACLNTNELISRWDVGECYALFYKFARGKAKLAEGCIFLEEELLGTTHEDYKSVFYTLFKLANQAREKFEVMALVETRKIDWLDLRKRRQNLVNEYAETEGIVDWSFAQVNKANRDVLELMGKSLKPDDEKKFHIPELAVITPQIFIEIFQDITLRNGNTFECIYAFVKNAFDLSDQSVRFFCWEEEFLGNTYANYLSVFCTLYQFYRRHDGPIAKPTRKRGRNKNEGGMAEADNHKAKDRARSSLSDVENGGFPIFIETVTGKTLTLRVSKSDSIGSIKKRIAESEGIPPSKQRLMVEDEFHPLADGRKLADYNIAKDDTMLLLPEQCGC